MAKTPKPKILATSASMTGVGRGSPELGKLIEDAMIRATEECTREGITDPDEIRARKLAARDKVLGG